MSIPFPELSQFLDGHSYETRQKWYQLSKDEIFRPKFDISIRDQKELALQRLQKVAENKVFSVKDFKFDPLNVFANHEQAGYVDGSMATKMTVQLNLFGGTVYTLGTERHLAIAEGVDNLSTIGCFALTELGYGNNAVQMGTTAHYNKEKSIFLINTPTILSQKYWITNGAYHCNYAIVFAQLIMPGDQKEGVHAFLVRVRNEDGSLRPGVFIEDMGHKFGLNGVDNGRLKFTNVEVPREGLLNRFSEVHPDGSFTSQIKNKRQRFLTVADRLLSGRLCIASMQQSATKLGLLATIRFGHKRLAVGQTGKSDTGIAQFGLFQNQIYPLLAKTLIFSAGFDTVKKLYADSLLKGEAATQYLVCLCCVSKPLITWNSRDVGTTIVERVGGQGYLSVNRVSEVLPFSHSGITAEGDNGVLMQKVAKELLALMQKGKYTTPKPRNSKQSYDFNQIESYIDLLRVKEAQYAQELAQTTASKMGEGKNIYTIWMREDNDLVQGFARAFGERMLSEFAYERIQKASQQVKQIMLAYLKLHLTSTVERDLGYFIFQDFITAQQAKQIHSQQKKNVQFVHQFALDTVNSFGIPEHLITAPMAQDYEAYNNGVNNGEHRPKL